MGKGFSAWGTLAPRLLDGTVPTKLFTAEHQPRQLAQHLPRALDADAEAQHQPMHLVVREGVALPQDVRLPQVRPGGARSGAPAPGGGGQLGLEGRAQAGRVV